MFSTLSANRVANPHEKILCFVTENKLYCNFFLLFTLILMYISAVLSYFFVCHHLFSSFQIQKKKMEKKIINGDR